MYLTVEWYAEGTYEYLIYALDEFVTNGPFIKHWDHVDIWRVEVFDNIDDAMSSFEDDGSAIWLIKPESQHIVRDADPKD